MHASQLKIYSLGTVAANKALSSMDIEVLPLEDAPMTDGELNDQTESYASTASDTAGSAYQVEVATANTIKATWLPLGLSNRMTAPDVRRGETVVLYRFADVDKFYWTTLKNDMQLRKLETVIFAFSGTKDESADANADNTYFLEISTHQKLIHLHTSQANGEPFTYDIQLNTDEGYFVIQDNVGNSIFLDSKENEIRMSNADGSFLDILKKEIFMSSPDLIDMKAKQIKATATNMNIEALTNIQGNLSQSGAGGGKGTASFNSTMDTTGDMIAGGISLQNHTHPGDSGGSTGKPR